MMTVEGQPLSDNVKKRRDALVKYAIAAADANGGKYEDSGDGYNGEGGFPRAPGTAAGGSQPEVYSGGAPGAHEHGVVTQWLRPSEMSRVTSPMLFKNDYEVEGIIQGEGTTNRWLLSALNIIGGNREQLARVFMEHEEGALEHYEEKGFFVCKFYQDDPLSDDDWQVILVDGRIPCDANGVPCFARCKDDNVYWAMIVEKAFAKYLGCYDRMAASTVTQGLEDLTGGIGYKFDLEKPKYADAGMAMRD